MMFYISKRFAYITITCLMDISLFWYWIFQLPVIKTSYTVNPRTVHFPKYLLFWILTQSLSNRETEKVTQINIMNIACFDKHLLAWTWGKCIICRPSKQAVKRTLLHTNQHTFHTHHYATEKWVYIYLGTIKIVTSLC